MKQEDAAMVMRPGALLLLGGAMLVLSSMRWGVGALGWVAYLPFLLYAERAAGKRDWPLLYVCILAALTLVVAKIVTYPIPLFLAPVVALPLSVAVFLVFPIWRLIHRHRGALTGIYAFPLGVVVLEWLLRRTSPLGVWGSLANTQVDNLPLLQLASVTGAAGISFLLAWFSSLAAAVIRDGITRWKTQVCIFVAVLLTAYTYGTIRIQTVSQVPTTRMAAVTSDFIFAGSFPGKSEQKEITDSMFLRTREAAQGGARVVVWNEGATGAEKENEPELIERGKQEARQLRIHLLLAYVVRLRDMPLLLDNKYVWIGPDGVIRQTYRKHYIPVGEPSIAGTAPLQAVSTEFGRMAGAICYDYDNPEISKAHGRLGAGAVMLPSSDWKGIDPIHTQMAMIRAIENGFSLLRSTRAAASAAFDSTGRARAWMNYAEANEHIMIADLPVHQSWTPYLLIGDGFSYLCPLLVAGMLVPWKRPARA